MKTTRTRIDWESIFRRSVNAAEMITEIKLLKNLRREFKLERGRYANPAELVELTKKLIQRGVLTLTTPELDDSWQEGTKKFVVDISKLDHPNPKPAKTKKEKAVITKQEEKVRTIRLKTNKFSLIDLHRIFGKVENFGEDDKGFSVYSIQLNESGARSFLTEIAPKLVRGEDMFDLETTPDAFQRNIWKMSDYCKKCKEDR